MFNDARQIDGMGADSSDTSKVDFTASLSDLSHLISSKQDVVLCFRENGEYEEVLPFAEQAIRELGCNLRWHTFPSDTSEADIEIELSGFKTRFANSIILLDYTCSRNLPLKGEEVSRCGSVIAGTIDGTVSEAELLVIRKRYGIKPEGDENDQRAISSPTQLKQYVLPEDRIAAVWGKGKLRPSRAYVNGYGECVTKLLEEALTNSNNPLPNHFLVIAPALLQHAPFFRFYAALTFKHAELFGDGTYGISTRLLDPARNDSVFQTSIFHPSHLGRFGTILRRTVNQPFEEVQKWIEKAGIPQGNITVIKSLPELVGVDWNSRPLTVIADRHVVRDLESMLKAAHVSKSEIDQIRANFDQHLVLPLPLENFRPALFQKGLIAFSPSEEKSRVELIKELILEKIKIARDTLSRNMT
ncbi:MAG: hypothetical protein DCC75_01990 [Proteobacteria bacterium]|nr:MAG: hypothetical protein DCC75_01990 [Pseudomonadota bacterium]